MVLNEEQWIKELREKRIAYGISQGKLAVASGITREYLNKIESRKMKPSKELLNTLHKELARFNPEAPLTMLFDYVKIRFPTLDIQHIIKDILKLNINYMLHEDYGRYSYTEHYSLGDIFIYTSADEEKGVLLELKGRGCRQFESYLLAQQRSWYDFLMDALVDGGVMKRIDLAINDHTGILDIPELAEKCRKREYIGKSRSYKFYQSGELIKALVLAKHLLNAIDRAFVVSDKPLFVGLTEIILLADPDTLKDLLHLFLGGGELHPLTDQHTLVVFAKVRDEGFKITV